MDIYGSQRSRGETAMTRNNVVVNFSPKKLAGRSNSIAMGGPSPTHFS